MSSAAKVRMIAQATAAVVAIVALAVVPYSALQFGGLLPGPLNSPGTLQLFSLMFVAAAAAVTLDVMFGYTGLLSLGHALYFGFGAYAVVMLTNSPSLSLGAAAVLAAAITFVVSLIGNAVALRLNGLGYAMATLALAQLLMVSVERGYLNSGGEVGIVYEFGSLPAPMVGVMNTKNIYWISLVLIVLILAICGLMVCSWTGHAWQAIRENELRARLLGYNVYAYKVASATIASTLAGFCGIVQSLVIGGANPTVVSLGYSVSLVLMVVLGGRGVLWGAALGALAYTYLNLRLSSASSSDFVAGLPRFLEVPLSQPNFILGVVFIVVIIALPGGLASVASIRPRRRARRSPTGDLGASSVEQSAHVGVGAGSP